MIYEGWVGGIDEEGIEKVKWANKYKGLRIPKRWRGGCMKQKIEYKKDKEKYKKQDKDALGEEWLKRRRKE